MLVIIDTPTPVTRLARARVRALELALAPQPRQDRYGRVTRRAAR